MISKLVWYYGLISPESLKFLDMDIHDYKTDLCSFRCANLVILQYILDYVLHLLSRHRVNEVFSIYIFSCVSFWT